MIAFVLETVQRVITVTKKLFFESIPGFEGNTNPFSSVSIEIKHWITDLWGMDFINDHLLAKVPWYVCNGFDGMEMRHVRSVGVDMLVQNLSDGMYRDDPVYLKKLIQYCVRGV